MENVVYPNLIIRSVMGQTGAGKSYVGMEDCVR